MNGRLYSGIEEEKLAKAVEETKEVIGEYNWMPSVFYIYFHPETGILSRDIMGEKEIEDNKEWIFSLYDNKKLLEAPVNALIVAESKILAEREGWNIKRAKEDNEYYQLIAPYVTESMMNHLASMKTLGNGTLPKSISQATYKHSFAPIYQINKEKDNAYIISYDLSRKSEKSFEGNKFSNFAIVRQEGKHFRFSPESAYLKMGAETTRKGIEKILRK